MPWRKLANTAVTGLVFTSLIWVLCSESRPLVVNSQIVESKRLENVFILSRTEQYFINRPDLKEAYLKAVETLRDREDCGEIGLLLGGDTWEYPFWALLDDRPGKPMRFEHIALEKNESLVKASSAYKAFSPCAIIASERPDKDVPELRLDDKVYSREWHQAPVSLFLEQFVSPEKRGK
ncbi:MAG: hypothetical protein HC925_05465 [Coleofasciculaceae cyanobacterium SM2_3_26]|nr:hypothetical protein [Coleofasciculaceae cyanobacterium SM2_3_26]